MEFGTAQIAADNTMCIHQRKSAYPSGQAGVLDLRNLREMYFFYL